MHPARTPRLRAAVPLALLLAGCALPRSAGPQRWELFLTERPAPVGRSCHPAAAPAVLPAADAVVDSAALLADVERLWAARGLRAGYALLSLAFDRNGWNARRKVIEHDLPAPVADSLQQLVFAHRRTVPPGEPWGVRLRLEPAGARRLRVGRQELCAARARDPLVLAPTSTLDVGARRGAWRYLPPHATLRVRALVDEHGTVVDARLESGASAQWEGRVLNYVRMLSIEPALVDGIPVASWVRVPVAIAR